MKKKVFIVGLTCGLLAALTAITAYAQFPGTRVRATIPFDFIVRGKVLPAGNYEIRRLGDEPANLEIFSLNHKRDCVLFETASVQPHNLPTRGEIVFNRYGDTYFLSEVFAGGGEPGREIPPSRKENNLRREMTSSNKAEPETVAVAVY